MSVVLSQNPSNQKSIMRALPWAGMGLCLALLLGHIAYDVLAHAHSLAAGTRGAASDARADAKLSASRSTVSLSEAKLKEAKIAIEPGAIRPDRDGGRGSRHHPGQL